MSEHIVPVTVRILDKEYRVACQEQEQESLLESAHLLDHRMREIRQTGRVIGIDRIAVMAALNISHELLTLKNQQHGIESQTLERIQNLQSRIADTLAMQRQLDARTEAV